MQTKNSKNSAVIIFKSFVYEFYHVFRRGIPIRSWLEVMLTGTVLLMHVTLYLLFCHKYKHKKKPTNLLIPNTYMFPSEAKHQRTVERYFARTCFRRTCGRAVEHAVGQENRRAGQAGGRAAVRRSVVQTLAERTLSQFLSDGHETWHTHGSWWEDVQDIFFGYVGKWLPW